MASWTPPTSFRDRPVAVLGAGVLGRRIAACWLAGGWNVRLLDLSEAQRHAASEYVEQNMQAFTALTSHEPGTLTTHEDLAVAVKDCWIVFEAIPEKLALKESVFADLEKFAPGDCILASNSSSYKSSEMIGKVNVETKTRILNTHYMMPPQALVVELMTDGHTTPEIFPWLAERLREAGLHPVIALKESTGFVLNRIWAAIKRETLQILSEGVSVPADIDSIFKETYGARIGPCAMMDNVGLDTVSHIEHHYVQERGLESQHLDWLDRNFITESKLGKKTPDRGGLYDAPKPGSQTKLIFLNLGVAEPLDDKMSFHQVLHRGTIQSLNVSEQLANPVDILSHEYMPDGIDVADGRIYWTDMGNPSANDGAVWSAKLDGTDIKAIVKSGDVHTPKQLICDVEDQKLYFCDREGYRVMRVSFDGSNLETLVQTGDWRSEKKDETFWCVGIAISKQTGKIYWTQKGPSKGSQGRILSASLSVPKDPANREDIEVLASNLPEPIDLELDDENGILYWTDRGELPLGNTLNKKTLRGEVPAAEQKLGRQVLAQSFGEAIGLKLDRLNDCIWVADISGHIWKCNPHRPAFKEKVYEAPTGSFTGLTLVRV